MPSGNIAESDIFCVEVGCMKELLKAVDRMIHLHMCEQEGIDVGQPSPDDWYKAVDNLADQRARFDDMGYPIEQKDQV